MIEYTEPYEATDGHWMIDEIEVDTGLIDATYAYPTEAAARSAYAQLTEANHAQRIESSTPPDGSRGA